MSGIVGSYFNTRGSGIVAKLGTDGQIFTSTGAGLSQGFEAAAAGGDTWTYSAEQATTSGTVITFTGIAAGTRHIRMVHDGTSGSGDSFLNLEIGDAGGFETSGYVSSATNLSQGTYCLGSNSTTTFRIAGASAYHDASSTWYGIADLYLTDESNEVWTLSAMYADNAKTACNVAAGRKSLSAEITQIRMTISTGAWDAGTIGIITE